MFTQKIFQFSLWDSDWKHIPWCRRGKTFNSLYEILIFFDKLFQIVVCFTFNSLYEIRNYSLKRTKCCKVNFQFSLWDSIFIILELEIVLDRFQFSLWDSIPEALTAYFASRLSILFMRFCWRIWPDMTSTFLSILFMRFY